MLPVNLLLLHLKSIIFTKDPNAAEIVPKYIT